LKGNESAAWHCDNDDNPLKKDDNTDFARGVFGFLAIVTTLIVLFGILTVYKTYKAGCFSRHKPLIAFYFVALLTLISTISSCLINNL
jgi:hypothetical protein